MEEGSQAPDWDSDETVIEGSVMESDLEEEELPWRSLFWLFFIHKLPTLTGMRSTGTRSPEIQLKFKLREEPQEQISKNKMIPVLSEDAVLQPPDEMEQNQSLLQKSCPVFTVSLPQAELSLNHQSIQGPTAENPEVLPHPEKELSADRDSPEISILSGTAIKVSELVAVKEKLLIEPQKILAGSNTFSEFGKEVTFSVTSEETKDEESSLETFVSALEKLLTSPEITQEERLFEIMSDFEPRELMNPLSNSPNSISIPLTCHRDLLENTKDDALPAELLAALNTLSEAKVGPICHRNEGGSSLSAESECVGIKPNISQTDADCTQISEVNFESLCSTPPFEQDSKLSELQDKHLSVQQVSTLEDSNPLGKQTLVQQNAISCDPLNNKGNLNPVENSSDQDTPCVLRRSSRVKIGRYAKHTDDMYKMPEKILPKILGCENQTNNNSSTENFRIQDPAIMIKGKRKNVHSSRLKSGEQIWKNRKLTRKNDKMKMNKISLSSINRRNIFGENLLYKAALSNNADLVHHCIKKGGNVNQPSYAGWTALHEASVGGFYETASELVKGGADVNIKGMYQITPLHDAVMNRHYKVAELLLLNGADPLFRSDNGKCALDEAKDACMKRLLERYVHKHQKHLVSAQKNSNDPLDIEDAHQHKKRKFTSKNCIGFICDENSNRQNPEHIKIDKGSKESLFIKKEDVYEHYQRDFRNTKSGKSKHQQSVLNQIYSTGFRKDNLHNVKIPSTNMSKYKGRRNTQHKSTQVDNAIQESNPRKTIAISSSRRINRWIIPQQHILQTLDDLPEESRKPCSPALSGLKNGFSNNIEAYSVPREKHTKSLDLSDNQEIKFLELEPIDQAKAASFSGLSLYKEIELPVITTDQQPNTHQEQQYISLCKYHENSNSGEKESFSKWETFNDDNHGDCCTSEKTVTSKKIICSTGCKSHYNYKENLPNREEMDFQQFLPSEDHFSQEDELKAGSLSILPQQEAVNFSNSDNRAVSEPHVANYEQCMYDTSFDHLHGNPDHTSLACTRTISTHEVPELISHMEQFKRPLDCSPKTPTPLMNQTDTHIVEKVNKNEGTNRKTTDKGQKPRSSNGPLSTVVHSQVIKTTEVEKRRQSLPNGGIIHNIDFHPTDNVNKGLISISQLNQREEKEISHQPDEELANNINGDENIIINCEEEKEKTDSEICISTNIQEHKKVQNFRKRQNFLKAACSKEKKTAGISKRNARGESQLHLAARRGNLSLVKALIESGADVNLKDNAGWTPLHKASSEGSKDIIVELLKAGANVNCENLDGILPLHDAVANNHLKVQYPSVLVPLRFCTFFLYFLILFFKVKVPAVQPKRHNKCFCEDCKTVDSPSLSHQDDTRESLPVHQTISAILQDIEEKQENLLEFEIRTPEDAEQYIEKMLEIKEVMDNVLAKQKAVRDDLAKKYRVSIESFKHGVLREQLANLATRQKSLLVAAKKQKKISQKIQNYKNVTSLSGLSLKKLPFSSQISSEKDSQEFTSLENSVQPQSSSLSPASRVCGNIQETQLSRERWNNSQNTNTCLNLKTARREEFSGNELNSKQNVSDCNLDELPKSRSSDGTKKIKLPSQPVAFIAQAECSQKENDLTETIANGYESCSPSALTGTLNISETTSTPAQNDAQTSAVVCGQAFSNCDPKRGNRKTASQQPPRRASETLTHQGIDDLGCDTGHQMKPYLKKSAFAAPHANDSQSTSSPGSGCPHITKKPSNQSTALKKKCMQIKDLIVLGRINPGNILEFKTQEATHKASVLLSGKIKVENGQIYQNPVTWLKDLLGGDSYVTWNYAWSKTGTSRESMQGIPPYLQINEILLVSDQEFLPCHIMDQHWKFYVECEELTF
ncbi:putative ankyrin repeat domain-containing protein 31 [Pteropus vampyrus]|uniref:Ankyrin repeat domain-containing protein 31 n=1 Tax=Pteropus vampyrus TaxID=132908 RepID=A0A6P6BM80_PTEVA|nr:putative ankyrin repeat domain-containing protein 31 [Pteropus vampyrus]